MKTSVGALVIATLMWSPAVVAQSGAREQAARLRPGSKIEVQFTGGETLRGRMGVVTAETLQILPEKSSTAAARLVPWNEIAQVKNKERSLGAKVAILGASVFGVLVVIGLIARAAGCC